MSPRYTCPCCGHQTLTERPGAYDLCPVCCWEDDGWHEDDAVSVDGPNGITLAEGQRRYRRHGTSALRCLPNVRPPRGDEPLDPAWRPIDLSGTDERQYFMSDFGGLLDSLTETARRRARETRSDADIARFEGLREAITLYVKQVDGFGIPRQQAGIDPTLELERDYLLDPPEGYYAG